MTPRRRNTAKRSCMSASPWSARAKIACSWLNASALASSDRALWSVDRARDVDGERIAHLDSRRATRLLRPERGRRHRLRGLLLRRVDQAPHAPFGAWHGEGAAHA